MRALKFIFILVSLISFLSCNKNETEEINNPEVENYIELLKANQYESGDLPEFASEDIPALLVYINDNSKVNKFPHSPLSSFAPPYPPDYRLGVLVLWTIESIRAVSCNNAHFHRLPSQHPFIQTKSEPIEWFTDHDDEAYETIRQAYSNWWNENKQKKFSNFCNIDPLINTDYSWH